MTLTAMQERDAGMDRALGGAEANLPGWSLLASIFLSTYAHRHPSFISEDVSDASKLESWFPQPGTDRAWGHIYRMAAKDGLIVMDGLGRSRRRHNSVCPRWRSLIYTGAYDHNPQPPPGEDA